METAETGKYRYSAEQRALLEGLAQPLAIYQFLNKRVVTLVLSDGFCELFGYEDRALAYRDMDLDMYKDTHPDDAARIAEAALRFAVQGGRYEVIYRTRSKTGGYRMVHAAGRHVYTDSGVRLAEVWYTDEGPYIEDAAAQVSELNRAFTNALHEESLLRASSYDYLTGLPNMAYFFELADAAKGAMLKAGEHPALLYLDLHGMKFFNSHNSFEAGDRLLQDYAAVLRSHFGTENCCRIGGDHFAVVSAERGLEEKLDAFFRDCRDINHGNNLPVRVGIYSSRLENVHVSTACDRAKFACDAIRDSYESGYHYYDHRMRDEAERRQHILVNFDRALREHWIQVCYQPIVRAVNGHVCDEEALSRWNDPERGLLSPASFIPALEEAGMIYRLDLYVLEQILEKMRLTEKAGLRVVPHSLNLSRSDFSACDMVEEIRRRVDAAGIPHDRITIEITESTIGSDFEFMKKQVERFQALGFPVWMDDFGSGYSSLDLLQSIKFNLIKFDMSFMQKLDEGDGGKIILTELMKMATALGVETICEGVETKEQAQFLREIGCAKLQGFYYCRPIPLAQIIERNRKGIQIGYENPEEAAYFEAIGRVNLYDLAVIAHEDENAFQNFFNTLPMAIMEIRDGQVRFTRTNQSYRDFVRRFFGVRLAEQEPDYSAAPFGKSAVFLKLVQSCCQSSGRSFFDERMPDGAVVHSFARRIATNPVTGTSAAAVAVLSITEPDEGATYAGIARALAADYYNIYCVDLDTERFIEYSSPVGGEELAMERHGEDFFRTARQDAKARVYEEDRDTFLGLFTKENVVRELDRQGVFTVTYRLIENGEPLFVNMKIMRMHQGGNQIILGVSGIDSQMKQKALIERIQKERDVLTQVMALSENYLSLYTIQPETGRYVEYSTTSEYDRLGFDKEGENFFEKAVVDGKKSVCPEDLPRFLEEFDREKIMRAIREKGAFNLHYRLMIEGEPRPVSLRIARVKESSGEKLVAGVRAWQPRRED